MTFLSKKDRNEALYYKKIKECEIIYPDHLSERCKEMLRKMLMVNPLQRAKLEEIKAHSFYRQGQKKLFNKFSEQDVSPAYLKQITKTITENMLNFGYSRKEIEENIQQDARNSLTACFDLFYLKLVNDQKNNKVVNSLDKYICKKQSSSDEHKH